MGGAAVPDWENTGAMRWDILWALMEIPGISISEEHSVWFEQVLVRACQFRILMIKWLHCIYRLTNLSQLRDQTNEWALATLKQFSLHKIWLQSKSENCDVTEDCDVSGKRTTGNIWVYPGQWSVTVTIFSLNPLAAVNQSKQLLSFLKICLIFIFKYSFWIVSFHRFNVILSRHIW